MTEDRLPPIERALWTAEQAECADEIINGPRGALISPFVPLLRSPELMRHAQRMGEYLRYRSALGLRLSEFAILLVARAWNQDVEWAIHVPIARREGIAATTIEDIAMGRRPSDLSADEAVVYAFWHDIETRRTVSDVTWRSAIERWGPQATVDLLGILGYYAMLAMVMNAAGTPVPETGTRPLPPATRPAG